MADAGLFIGWGEVARGREKYSLQVFNEALQYYAGLEQDGKIESSEVVLLEPHGGDLQGFILVRGSEEQMSTLRADEEFGRQIQRAIFVVDRVGVVSAALGAGLESVISTFGEEAEKLP
jgi:hypothetical protein